MNTSKDLSKILRNYENKWVALSGDRKRVVSSGNTLEETIGGVDEKEREKVAYTKVLPLDAWYIPHI